MEMKKEVNEKVELIEKVEQPNFSVENIRETRPAYHRSGDLVWKNKPKRPKQYVQYPIEKIHYSNEFIVREDILEKHPEVEEVLNKLSGKIDEETMINLNYKRKQHGFYSIY